LVPALNNSATSWPRHVNELLRQAVDGVHIFTVRPASAFCVDLAVGDNPEHRYNWIRYRQPGAKVYFDAIIPQLLTLPSSPYGSSAEHTPPCYWSTSR
jgi:hypothetical protein